MGGRDVQVVRAMCQGLAVETGAQQGIDDSGRVRWRTTLYWLRQLGLESLARGATDLGL